MKPNRQLNHVCRQPSLVFNTRWMMKKLMIAMLLISILLTACAPAQSAEPSPIPVDVEAIQTEAVKTVIAAVTQTAAALPTETPAPPTETPVPTETVSPTPEDTPTATQVICNNAIYVEDVTIPDESEVNPGQRFTKTWKVKNTGACDWTRAYSLRYGFGDRMGGLITYLEDIVPAGDEVEISIQLVAPQIPGSYRGYWVLNDNNGYTFGEYLSIIIVVP
jgi:mRNA-degrading endonuclease toxin of MazEF toxin-antitoxin module